MSPASRDEVDGDPALRLRFLQRKEIYRAVSRRCYVARDVSTEWPIPVFHCVVVSALVRPLMSLLIVDLGCMIGGSGLSLLDPLLEPLPVVVAIRRFRLCSAGKPYRKKPVQQVEPY